MKQKLKAILKKLPINVTRNQKYDALTLKIMEIVLEEKSTFVDVGCHKGELLQEALKFAPKGQHFGFEPIPYLFDGLKTNFGHLADIRPFALSDTKGKTTFMHVETNPAYSGIKKRTYPKKETVKNIEVEVDLLDNQLQNVQQIGLLKIDVEGAEMGVLKGAKNVLIKHHPVVIFEHGKGASDYYGTKPEDVWSFLNSIGYSIFTLSKFIGNKQPYTLPAFIRTYNQNKEYYFVAKPNL